MFKKFKPKIYIKDNSNDPFYKAVNREFYFKSRIISASLFALGTFVLGTQVLLPLISFKTQDETPEQVAGSVLGLASGFEKFTFTELQTKEVQEKTPEPNVPPKFFLTIPKLGVTDAVVETNSSNLSPDTALGHYKGSALPGKAGNAFIYGHSVLPVFYNPRNYKTIFATLGNLETGDDIYVRYNNTEIKYKVESKEQLKPENVDPLAEFKPKYLNESTLELMTCWPAGTKARRLLVKAIAV